MEFHNLTTENQNIIIKCCIAKVANGYNQYKHLGEYF